MSRPRPHAVTSTDELLVHVLDVLDEIRDRLPAPKQEPAAGPAKVSEPAKRTTRGSRGGN